MKLADMGYVIDHDVWLTPNEAAELWGCHRQTLYQKKHQGEFPDEFIVEEEFGPSWWIHREYSPLTRTKQHHP